MAQITRRTFVGMAVAMGATAVWGSPFGSRSTSQWRERREFFPEGVASGHPDNNSVLLWTRYAGETKSAAVDLQVEVAEDQSFQSVVARSHVRVLAAADYTCRVLVGQLQPSRVYWYRFTDKDGNGSRI